MSETQSEIPLPKQDKSPDAKLNTGTEKNTDASKTTDEKLYSHEEIKKFLQQEGVDLNDPKIKEYTEKIQLIKDKTQEALKTLIAFMKFEKGNITPENADKKPKSDKKFETPAIKPDTNTPEKSQEKPLSVQERQANIKAFFEKNPNVKVKLNGKEVSYKDVAKSLSDGKDGKTTQAFEVKMKEMQPKTEVQKSTTSTNAETVQKPKTPETSKTEASKTSDTSAKSTTADANTSASAKNADAPQPVNATKPLDKKTADATATKPNETSEVPQKSDIKLPQNPTAPADSISGKPTASGDVATKTETATATPAPATQPATTQK